MPPGVRSSVVAAPPQSALRCIALFAALPADALDAVRVHCSWRRFRPGEGIVSRAASDSDVYFILSGSVRVTAFGADGHQVTYRDMGAGEWFGDLAAIDCHMRSADIVALSDVFLGAIHAGDFMELVTGHTSAATAEVHHLATWIRDLTNRLYDLSTLGVRNRVHAELLRRARDAGVIDNVAQIAPAPRHAEMASRVSTYREQVSRELSNLAQLGVVARQSRALVVCDVARLERMVAAVRSESDAPR